MRFWLSALLIASQDVRRSCALDVPYSARSGTDVAAFWMQTTGACQVGTSSAGSQRCLGSCVRAVVRPCCCTSCCTELTLICKCQACHGRAIAQTSIPQKKAATLGSMTPMTVSSVPAVRNAGRWRARVICASRMTPMTVSSAPVRSHQRIRPPRASRVQARSPDLLVRAAEELHTTRFRRCDRTLMAGSSGEDGTT